MPLSLEKIVRAAAWTACPVVLAMLVLFLMSGVGQDPLQSVHSGSVYSSLLLRNPAALRATLALDNLFIVLYGTAFVGTGVLLVRRGTTAVLAVLVSVLLGAVALLDSLENLNFLVLLAQAEQGSGPSDAAIGAQVLESLFKFHVSYLGLFLLGLALPRRTASERWLARLCCYVQLPVGLAIHVTPPAVAFPLVLVRFAFFLSALILAGWIFGAPTAAGGSGAPE
ncbi:MAG TPA: hypothetical protein VNN80_30890 [Polyangiaceae bacterium]|nr:hypothetical protein [Polyangiaceae bacterium]